MLLITCPYCDTARPEIEFRNAGEAHVMRPTDPAAASDADWAGFLYLRDNPKGVIFERWRHIHGCGRFFNAVRDTVSDAFVMTYKAGDKQPDLSTVLEPASTAKAPRAKRKDPA